LHPSGANNQRRRGSVDQQPEDRDRNIAPFGIAFAGNWQNRVHQPETQIAGMSVYSAYRRDHALSAPWTSANFPG
jgi:hypothetical protein